MIGLRVIHVLDKLRVSAASSETINIMRWLKPMTTKACYLLAGPVSVNAMSKRKVLSSGVIARVGLVGGLAVVVACLQDIEQWRPDLIHIHNLECLGVFLSVAVKLELTGVGEYWPTSQRKGA